MRDEVMQHFGLTAPFEQAGYYESAHHQALIEQIRGAITESRLVAVCGAIGSGKTVLLQRLRQILKDEDKISVSTSFALEKHRLGRPDFISSASGVPGFPVCAMPALFTSTSRRPNSFRMRSAAAPMSRAGTRVVLIHHRRETAAPLDSANNWLRLD